MEEDNTWMVNGIGPFSCILVLSMCGNLLR